ncbi:DUF6440 family protein [Rhodococcus sp. IEGM 1408]|uniref:DUF6440 family protein n=1 Tax=Rhodococcus sp. IEGM 1408 TaxID=3082220 RepID=UPI0029558EBA|nr:DUF6440 family protein [Rhodococcus sp. IEGM 1408]MDV8001422.1 DUF6440 family protein [Rhodococcus sp. IEGM 1408]
MADREKGFKKIHSERLGFNSTVEILKDTQTGVCYLWRASGYGGGLTPMLGADGKPVVDHSL